MHFSEKLCTNDIRVPELPEVIYQSINYMFSIHGIPYLHENKMTLHITQLTFKIFNFQENIYTEHA